MLWGERLCSWSQRFRQEIGTSAVALGLDQNLWVLNWLLRVCYLFVCFLIYLFLLQTWSKVFGFHILLYWVMCWPWTRA